MKKISLVLSTVLIGVSFFSHPLKVFALDAPTLDPIPGAVNANTYTLVIHTQKGASITLVGGSSELAPFTDGEEGDIKDGVVKITVPLAQNTMNGFSIAAQLNGETSEAILIQINEVSTQEEFIQKIPAAPMLDAVPAAVESSQYKVSGIAEASVQIYARTVGGTSIGTAQADAAGKFEFTVPLETDKTNRFNFFAKNQEGNESKSVQVVIRQSLPKNVPGLPTPPAASPLFFSDVQGHWAKEYIDQLSAKKIVSGKAEGVFDPEGYLTRAELTKIALLAFDQTISDSPEEISFKDVLLDAWHAPYIAAAKKLKMVDGHYDGTFRPNDFINRASTLKILLRAAGITPPALASQFPDVGADAWFSTYVSFAEKNGIITGYKNGMFGPGDFITRAQVSKVVVKLLEYKADLAATPA